MGFIVRALVNLFIGHREKTLGRALTGKERSVVLFVASVPFLLLAVFCFYMAYGRHGRL